MLLYFQIHSELEYFELEYFELEYFELVLECLQRYLIRQLQELAQLVAVNVMVIGAHWLAASATKEAVNLSTV